MNCQEAEQLFDAYLDGELSESLRLEFDAHRLACPLCEQKLAILEACAHTLAGDDDVPALSDDFTDRVMARVRQTPVPISRLRRRRWVTAAVLTNVAAAVAFLLWLALPHPRPGTTVATTTTATAAPPQPGPAEALDEALRDRSGVELYGYIVSRLEQALAARNKVREDLASLPRYALNLRLPERSTAPQPFASLLDALFPRPQQPSTADHDGGQVSF